MRKKPLLVLVTLILSISCMQSAVLAQPIAGFALPAAQCAMAHCDMTYCSMMAGGPATKMACCETPVQNSPYPQALPSSTFFRPDLSLEFATHSFSSEFTKQIFSSTQSFYFEESPPEQTEPLYEKNQDLRI